MQMRTMTAILLLLFASMLIPQAAHTVRPASSIKKSAQENTGVQRSKPRTLLKSEFLRWAKDEVRQELGDWGIRVGRTKLDSIANGAYERYLEEKSPERAKAAIRGRIEEILQTITVSSPQAPTEVTFLSNYREGLLAIARANPEFEIERGQEFVDEGYRKFLDGMNLGEANAWINEKVDEELQRIGISLFEEMPSSAYRANQEEWMIESFKSMHLPVDRTRIASVIQEADEMRRAGKTEKEVSDFIGREYQQLQVPFARKGVTPDPDARYSVPFDIATPRFVTQGVKGRGTHSEEGMHYCWDFLMPIGTEILAAREGTVGQVQDGFTVGGKDRSLLSKANSVLIEHADGTFAVYAHLRKGIPVKVDQRVERGEFIGYSGQTGYADVPHLHFCNCRFSEKLGHESVPILFEQAGQEGVPGEGLFAGDLMTPAEIQAMVKSYTPAEMKHKEHPVEFLKRLWLALRADDVEAIGKMIHPEMREALLKILDQWGDETQAKAVEGIPNSRLARVREEQAVYVYPLPVTVDGQEKTARKVIIFNYDEKRGWSLFFW